MPVFAGLDIASKTGLACLDGDRTITATWQAPKRKGQVFDDDRGGNIDPAHSGQIAASFDGFLRSWLIVNGVTHCAIEAPLRSDMSKTVTRVNPAATAAGRAVVQEKKPLTNQATIYRLYGLSFVACMVCARLNITPYLVNQSEWRKAFLGNGSPKDAKARCVAQCKMMRIPFSSVDACEALGCAFWLRGHLMPEKFTRANDLFALPPSGGIAATAPA